MAIDRDDDEKRLVRIEQTLDRLRKQQADLRQLIEQSRLARETRAVPSKRDKSR
jgi:hypothetical protein